MKQISGWWWPDSDKYCHKVPDEYKDIEVIMPYVKGRDVVIQAGGNVGIWAKYYSKIFNAVYTFEPDPENFECLVHNSPEPNIVKFNTALGNKPEMVNVGSPDKQHDNNCGAYQVIGAGIHPTIRIDDLHLPECDLICLDIEGYEKFALEGATETIKKYRPTVVLEQKPLPIMYGQDPDSASIWLMKEHNYDLVEKIHRDNILCPR